MTGVRARGRRRRWLWAALAALGHVGLFLLLSTLTPTAVFMTPNVVQVSLVRGEGPGAGEAAAASPAPDTPAAAADLPETLAEPTTDTRTEVAPPPPEPSAAAEPPDPIAPSDVAQPLDVLAAVQRLVDAEAADPPRPTIDSTGPPSQSASTGASDGGGGATCAAVAGVVLTALQTDEKVLGAIGRFPAEALSVAGALQLWDGRAWADEAGLGGKGASLPLQEAAVRALSSAPPECLDEPQIGPRFLIVEAGKRVVVLVLGSGVWRWRDLVTQTGIAVDLQSAAPAIREN